MIEQIIQCFNEAERKEVATQFVAKGNQAYIKIYSTAEVVTDRIMIQEVDGKIVCFIRKKDD